MWVGTAGGTLGVFTINRDDKKGLMLKETGEWYLGMELNVQVTLILCRQRKEKVFSYCGDSFSRARDQDKHRWLGAG